MPDSATPHLPPSKLAILAVARRQLAMAEEDYRAILAVNAGVSSAKELDQAGFTAVMARLEQLGFRSTSKRRPLPARVGMATPGQTALIRQLWAECTGGTGTDASLGKWLDRQFHTSSIRFITAELAPKVVGALKSMKGKLDARMTA